MRHIILRTFTGPFALMQLDDGSLRTGWVDEQLEEALAKSKANRRLLPELGDRLTAYFAGEEVDFSEVPLPGGAAFQRRCWQACRRIPRGVTITYAQLAQRAGSANAFRAAGQSMRHNPLPVIVPCHRVVGSSGTLHGFGGTVDADSRPLAIKRSLLEMEGALADEVVLPERSRPRRRTRALVTA
jgi:methylated-DNA-[protein]-cysteine S-methyltransferase